MFAIIAPHVSCSSRKYHLERYFGTDNTISFDIVNRKYLRRQRESPSPSRQIYHVFVWILAIVNIARATTDIWYDNVTWVDKVALIMEASSNTIVFAIEASVVVFVLHAHMQVWSELLQRVAIITGILFGLYTAVQLPVLYLNRHFISIFGYYSVYNYWIAVNSLWTLIYLVLLTFKAIGSEAIRMPSTTIRP